MSDFKTMMKGGWHPKGKEGGRESWRGDFKGINQVAGWMGKGKEPGQDARGEHVSRPLATLKDPSQFGPPPKNVNYHGGAALPNEITPNRSGWGAPLSQSEIESARAAASTPPVEEEQPQRPAPPALPYRADRTGLRTDNLPPPPLHKDQRTVSPAPAPAHTTQAVRPSPSLPPRLPSRQNTATSPPPPSYESATATQAPPTSASFLNSSAVNRLGNAGVSVPGLGIGNSNTNGTKPAAATASAKPKSWTAGKNTYTAPGLSELQSRFAKMNTSNTDNAVSPTATTPTSATGATSPHPQPTPQAPSWQQTRQALTTANSAYKDPSSVSLADAQAAATTAQDAQRSASAFRERHNETINAAQTRATQLNKRYNMTGRLNKFLEDANNAHDQQQQQGQAQPQQQQQQQQSTGATAATTPAQTPPAPQQPGNQWQPQQPVASPPPQSATPELTASISRKPPPPPPPKKPASMQAPPPVPLGTKPNFG